MNTISDLTYGCAGNPLQIRILRKWKPQFRRHETWFLGVDKNGDAIQILGQRTNQSFIESIFTVSNCYTLSHYNCPNLDEYQKIVENNIYVDVGLASAIERIPDTVTIPRTWFRFVSEPGLNDFAENPPYLPDFIGLLSRLRECKKECIDEPEKFNREELASPPTATIVVVTSLKASSFGGHGIIASPIFQYKLNVTITDPTGSIPTTLSDNTAHKLFGAGPDKIITDTSDKDKKTLPLIIKECEGKLRHMYVQMTRSSTKNNIRFIIIGIEDGSSISQSAIPATPLPSTQSTVTKGHTNIPLSSSSHSTTIARNLSFEDKSPYDKEGKPDIIEAAQTKLEEGFDMPNTNYGTMPIDTDDSNYNTIKNIMQEVEVEDVSMADNISFMLASIHKRIGKYKRTMATHPRN
ncbi:unnamed protein product [Lactuca saligna]|uniref:Uncharacterized protein n=1 Tax=Lactuca saligna TaxID=75948 RepID=A0AA35YZH6_LACSI|nr:unnamed protein product [Lactuca saligna]